MRPEMMHGMSFYEEANILAATPPSACRASVASVNSSQQMAPTADLTNIDDIDAMRAKVEAEFGTPDILVANAGGSFARPALVEEIDPDEWRASIEGNLTATFLTVRAFLPGMKARGSGNIITLSSAAARKPYPVAPVPYAAAKAGVQIFTQDLAAQVGPFGIVANCIAPETILTDAGAHSCREAGSVSAATSDSTSREARGHW